MPFGDGVVGNVILPPRGFHNVDGDTRRASTAARSTKPLWVELATLSTRLSAYERLVVSHIQADYKSSEFVKAF
jgi:hypothetical protein